MRTIIVLALGITAAAGLLGCGESPEGAAAAKIAEQVDMARRHYVRGVALIAQERYTGATTRPAGESDGLAAMRKAEQLVTEAIGSEGGATPVGTIPAYAMLTVVRSSIGAYHTRRAAGRVAAFSEAVMLADRRLNEAERLIEQLRQAEEMSTLGAKAPPEGEQEALAEIAGLERDNTALATQIKGLRTDSQADKKALARKTAQLAGNQVRLDLLKLHVERIQAKGESGLLSAGITSANTAITQLGRQIAQLAGANKDKTEQLTQVRKDTRSAKGDERVALLDRAFAIGTEIDANALKISDLSFAKSAAEGELTVATEKLALANGRHAAAAEGLKAATDRWARFDGERLAIKEEKLGPLGKELNETVDALAKDFAAAVAEYDQALADYAGARKANAEALKGLKSRMTEAGKTNRENPASGVKAILDAYTSTGQTASPMTAEADIALAIATVQEQVLALAGRLESFNERLTAVGAASEIAAPNLDETIALVGDRSERGKSAATNYKAARDAYAEVTTNLLQGAMANAEPLYEGSKATAEAGLERLKKLLPAAARDLTPGG